ncbi:DNA methyltransferase [Corynebacterium heidelbergense]|uniref:site-specific DNA-methyltransferase (adenine-specific) n=1 Tax=Corynebacterium heidelbergense TaxID=2055947 RepID=A0A364V6I0_9CORY|nr:DNA methyltransferase [Corynebacterium heidelbergense]RAV32221.1 SAM-dependent methyltransferase [Corynebacterium heidelbergense]
MPPLNLKTIEERVSALAGREEYGEELLFDLLLAYGRPTSSVTRLRTGSLNVAENPESEYAQKNVVYYRDISTDAPLSAAKRETRLLRAVEGLRTHERAVRYTTRFVIASDHRWLAAVDTKTNENRIFPIREIDKHYVFFLPWAGMEKAQFAAERHADTKAAEKMGKLFDALVANNSVTLTTDAERHGLNIFFTRLLFCYFAEDTELFPEGAFTKAIASQTQEDGSDVAQIITDIFAALDEPDKSDLPAHLQEFPYVNGRLFSSEAAYQVPKFDRKSRNLLIEMGRLIWKDINPDIFGSMFQAVVQSGSRSELGQHYTSVPNILKTIEPLFMDALKDQFEESYKSVRKLERLLDRIGQIKVFDPACGSANFLVIAYKELRRLEHAILDRLAALSPQHQTLFSDSVVKIDHFYGIEIDDFATEVAILALWIAKHQMNQEFKEKFGTEPPMIPLQSMGQITCANACRVDWEEVCPHEPEDEIYLIGNPPYLGASMQSKEQKEDLNIVYRLERRPNKIDYIFAWFLKGSEYIATTNAQLAFISTNSVTQGEQADHLFSPIFQLGVEIGYAQTSFTWSNNARNSAGVTVVVISLRPISDNPKYIFTRGVRKSASTINAYLADAPNVTLKRRSSALQLQLPPMIRGSMPTDGGHLLIKPEDRASFLDTDPDLSRYFKKYVGSAEFINSQQRYCLWVTSEDAQALQRIEFFEDRFRRVAENRKKSPRKEVIAAATRPWQFEVCSYRSTNSIIVPSVSSERRKYVPMGFLGPDTVISNLAFAVYDADPWLFALLTSKMHMAWLKAVGGKMKTDYRYSNTIVYNNFPVPHLTEPIQEKLTQAALRILDVREYFCECTLAELYDPDKMPDLLREAHAQNDALVDSIYRKTGFESDEERLAALFKLYEKMIAEEAHAAEHEKANKAAVKKATGRRPKAKKETTA